MSEFPNQRLIDELYRELKGHPENGNGHRKRAPSIFDDEQIIERCRKAENAKKFADLFDDGNTSGYASPSEADAALLSIVAFYTQDEDQLDRIYRRSALMRPKWERGDYRKRTIDFVLRKLTETHRSSGGAGSGSPIYDGTGTGGDGTTNDAPKLIRFRDIERKSRPPDLVESLIPANSLSLFYGAGGVAKSYIALLLGMTVAGAANDWLGFRVEHGPVVFADFELDSTEHGWRSHLLGKGLGLDLIPEDLHYMGLAACKPRQAFDALYTACTEVEAKLLILDSITVALEGDVEVARDFIGFVNHQVGRLRKAGVSTLALDHQGKLQSGERYQQKSAFGTSFKRHLSRSYAQLEPRDHGEGFLSLTFRHQKQNFAPLVDPFGIRVTFESNKVVVSKDVLPEEDLAGEETINARERVYKALSTFEGEEGTRSDIVEATGLAPATVKKELAALKRENPPRVWDTDRTEGRQSIVTTKKPPPEHGPDRTGSGSKTYKGAGTGTGANRGQRPLSSDLQPGQTATLKELREQREANQEHEERFK